MQTCYSTLTLLFFLCGFNNCMRKKHCTTMNFYTAFYRLIVKCNKAIAYGDVFVSTVNCDLMPLLFIFTSCFTSFCYSSRNFYKRPMKKRNNINCIVPDKLDTLFSTVLLLFFASDSRKFLYFLCVNVVQLSGFLQVKRERRE